ncbi:Plasmodium exported protein, unknown function [Plasmodium ovale]|uniref:Uncharacterized protein n=2 Tax=Plasmodium ovale TaxID=36330 RepID=A0A1D3JEB5_PLAOA|nr:Plasmodium exported protein, unknown function [Plasmodium ovale]
MNFSKIILYNLKFLGMVINELRNYADKKPLITNVRNLAEMSPLRLNRKRKFDPSLTIDEIQRLLDVLYVEAVSLNDLVASLLIFLTRIQHPNEFKVLIRDKVSQRLALEIPNYPELRKINMEKRLKEQIEEIVKIHPICKEQILYMHAFFKLEIDVSVELLDFAARQKTEEERNNILNDLRSMRLLLTARMMRNNIEVSDKFVTDAVLRARRRVIDVLEYHFDLQSHAQNN